MRQQVIDVHDQKQTKRIEVKMKENTQTQRREDRMRRCLCKTCLSRVPITAGTGTDKYMRRQRSEQGIEQSKPPGQRLWNHAGLRMQPRWAGRAWPEG